MFRLVFSATAIALLVGCTSSAKQVNEQVKAATQSSIPAIPADRLQEIAATTSVDWLNSFEDVQLSKLVQEARANNPNLQAAAANVERARALAIQAGAALKPAVNLALGRSGSGDNSSATPNVNNQSIGLQMSWEADIWGRIRSGQQASVASAEAAAADYQYTQHSLSATVTKTYLMAIEAGLQADITRQTLTTLEETLRIVTAKYNNGQASAQDVALTKSDLASARDSLATIEGSQRDALRALEVLLGRYPAAGVAINPELPKVPTLPANGLPSDLLERRPDMVAAERRVAAAFNATEQAKAARLPSLSLSGSLGGASNSLSSVLDPTNVAWQLAANLLAPLFDGGARQAQVEAANADQKQTIAAYAQTALTAFQEVENALDQGQVLAKRQSELETAAEQAGKAYRIADLRYREGETELLDVLTIEQRVNAARSNLASVKRLLLEQRINLYLALGGDWG